MAHTITVADPDGVTKHYSNFVLNSIDGEVTWWLSNESDLPRDEWRKVTCSWEQVSVGDNSVDMSTIWVDLYSNEEDNL